VKYEAQFAETTTLRGHMGDVIDAYFARPFGEGPYPGIVMIHHMPGWDESHKEIARRFAHHGYATLLPNLHFREGKATPEENSDSVRKEPEELTPRQPKAPIDFTENLRCPMLALFGIEDKRPSPEDAKKTEEALKRFGKTYEVHTYENAGHAFFAVDRPQYRVHAALDGWKRVFAWFEKYLKSSTH